MMTIQDYNIQEGWMIISQDNQEFEIQFDRDSLQEFGEDQGWLKKATWTPNGSDWSQFSEELISIQCEDFEDQYMLLEEFYDANLYDVIKTFEA